MYSEVYSQLWQVYNEWASAACSAAPSASVGDGEGGLTHSQDSDICSVASSAFVLVGEGVSGVDACPTFSEFVDVGERYVGFASVTS